MQPVSASVSSISMDAKDTFNINDINRGNNLTAAENTHLTLITKMCLLQTRRIPGELTFLNIE